MEKMEKEERKRERGKGRERGELGVVGGKR